MLCVLALEAEMSFRIRTEITVIDIGAIAIDSKLIIKPLNTHLTGLRLTFTMCVLNTYYLFNYFSLNKIYNIYFSYIYISFLLNKNAQ